MDDRWIIIASWGDPRGWSEVVYTVPLKIPLKSCKDLWRGVEEAEIRKVRSASATAAIARSILEKEHGSGEESSVSLKKVVIVASETLGSCRDIITQDGRKCLEYIQETAKDYINRYIRSNSFFGTFQGIEGIVDIVITPGIGLIKTDVKRVFRCNPANYAVKVFSELLKIFLEAEPTTVVVDISHGINYMPHILALMAEKAFKTYILKKLSQEEKVSNRESSYRIIVVNSDPYVSSQRSQQTEGGGDTLNINIISCEEIVSSKESKKSEESYKAILGELISAIDRALRSSQTPRVYRFKKGEYLKSITESLNKYNEEVVKEINGFIEIMETLNYGLLLPTLYSIQRLRSQGISNCIEVLDEALRYIDHEELIESKCRCGGDEDKGFRSVKVYRRMWLDPNILSLAVGSCVAKEGIFRSLGGIGDRTADQKELFSLEMLRELLKHITSSVAYEIAVNELNDIECRAKLVASLFGQEIMDKIYPYYVIYDLTEEIFGRLDRENIRDLCRCDNVDKVKKILGDDLGRIRERLKDVPKAMCDKMNKRNFYAHAGFEKNITLVRVRWRDGKLSIELGYDSNCREMVDKVIGEIRGV